MGRPCLVKNHRARIEKKSCASQSTNREREMRKNRPRYMVSLQACFEYAHLPGHIPGAQECPIHAGLCHDMGSPSKKKEAAYEKTQTAYCEQQGPGCAWGHLPLVHCAPLSSSGVPASEGHKGDSVSNRAVAQWLWHIAMHHRVASSDGLSTERYA